MEDCIFCRIGRKEVSADMVYEDEDVFAFLDNAPDAPGHTLVIPKKHYRNIFDMDETAFSPFLAAIQKVARALKEVVAAEGVNMLTNNEAAGGQIIFHAHAHVIPRKEGDGLRYGGKTERNVITPEASQALAEKMRAAII